MSLLSNKYRLNEISGELKRMGYRKMPQMRFTDVYGVTSRNGQPFHFSRPNAELPLDSAGLDVEDDDCPF